MNEKQKKAVGLGAVALAALAIFSSQTSDEPLPQGFSGGFPTTGTLGGGGVTREEPSLAEQLKNVFQPPPDLSGFTQEGPRVAQPSKYETLMETGTRIGTIPVPPELIQQGDISEFEKQKKDLDVAPSESFLEKFLGIDFKPAPSGSKYQKPTPTYTPGPTPVSYPGELKSPGVSYGGSIIGGIGQSTTPTKYISGGSSSSSRKSSTPSYGPIRYDTPSKAPETVEGIFTGGSSKSSTKKKSSGLTIRKTTAAERARSEAQRKAKLKIR